MLSALHNLHNVPCPPLQPPTTIPLTPLVKDGDDSSSPRGDRAAPRDSSCSTFRLTPTDHQALIASSCGESEPPQDSARGNHLHGVVGTQASEENTDKGQGTQRDLSPIAMRYFSSTPVHIISTLVRLRVTPCTSNMLEVLHTFI